MKIDMPDESIMHTFALLLEKREQVKKCISWEKNTLDELERGRVRAVKQLQDYEEQLLSFEAALASMGSHENGGE